MKNQSIIIFIFIFFFYNATALQSPEVDKNTDTASVWKLAYKFLTECSQKPSIMVCLKMKAVKDLNVLISYNGTYSLMDYVSFAKDPNVKEDEEENNLITDAELEASLPRNLDDQSTQLDQIIESKLTSFFSQRSLQMTMPMSVAEGRGKKYKYGTFMLLGLGFAAMIAQLFLGKIAIIAGKALVIAKVALVLSSVVGLKKIFSKGDGGEHAQVVYAQSSGGGEHGGGGWSHRSMGNELDAHSMAYNAHVSTDE